MKSIIHWLKDNRYVVTSNEFDYHTSNGDAYTLTIRFQLDIAQVYYLGLDTTGCGELKLIIYPFYVFPTSGPLFVDLIDDATWTGGTIVPYLVNRNQTSSKISKCVAYQDVTLTGGTPFAFYIAGSDSTRQNSGGGFVESTNTFISDPNRKKALKLENKSGSVINVMFRIDSVDIQG